jgi:type I restriction enzyme M protein
MSSSQGFSANALRDKLIAASEEFGTLMSPRARLEHLSAVLFLKRGTDVFAEETAAAIAELGHGPGTDAVIAANPDAYHLLRLPADATWAAVLGVDQGRIGATLDEALRAVAAANPRYLNDVFNTTDFNNRQVLPAADLSDVIREVHSLGKLTTERVSADVLGDAFLQVVDHFSRLEKPAKGEVFTPAPVAHLGARLLAPEANAQVHDPACGSGGLLLRVRDEAHRLHGDAAASLGLFGQERKPGIWLIARINALFHGAAPASRVEPGDSVLRPAFFEKQKFGLVVCNPPFELEVNEWYDSLRKGDPFERVTHLPGKSHPEMVFVQHMVASLSGTGRMAVLLPNGALFRSGAQHAVRREMVDADILEAVIGLPKGMFYGSGIPVSWVVVNKQKAPERKNQVLFLDASECFERLETTNVLREQDVDRIVASFAEGRSEHGFSAWVSTEDIRERRYNLTVHRYIRPAGSDSDLVPLSDALSELDAARAQARGAERALEPVLAPLRGPSG